MIRQGCHSITGRIPRRLPAQRAAFPRGLSSIFTRYVEAARCLLPPAMLAPVSATADHSGRCSRAQPRPRQSRGHLRDGRRLMPDRQSSTPVYFAMFYVSASMMPRGRIGALITGRHYAHAPGQSILRTATARRIMTGRGPRRQRSMRPRPFGPGSRGFIAAIFLRLCRERPAEAKMLPRALAAPPIICAEAADCRPTHGLSSSALTGIEMPTAILMTRPLDAARNVTTARPLLVG